MPDKVPSISISDTSKENERHTEPLSPISEAKSKENAGKNGPPSPTVSPKGRFHNAALKILSQVVTKRALGEDAVDGDGGPKGQQTGKTTPRKTRPSLANIATLYSLKRMSKLPGHRHRTRRMPQTIEEEKLDLPERPRFCATLSMEAQYAMMKCYEDILVENLESSFPETRMELQRSRTPKNAVLKSLIDDNDSKNDNTTGSTSLPAAPVFVTESLDSRSQGSSGGSSPAPSMGKSTPRRLMSYSASNGNGKQRKPEVPKETQLRLTCRFEKAMDILDTVRESKGQIVTSRRHKSNDIKPVNTYHSWSNNWTKEFTFETKS